MVEMNTKTKLSIMPNLNTGIKTTQRHLLPLPRMCPVSGNPQPGSMLAISYESKKSHLEVYALKEYVNEFIGGHPSGIRDMESTIQAIANECAKAISAGVSVKSTVILDTGDTLETECYIEEQTKEQAKL